MLIKLFDQKAKLSATPIVCLQRQDFAEWLEKQASKTRNWLKTNNFKAENGDICLFADGEGLLKKIYFGYDHSDPTLFSKLVNKLPAGNYFLKYSVAAQELQEIAIAWELASYRFDKYKNITKPKANLLVTDKVDLTYIENISKGNQLLCDLINTPAEDMGPMSLAKAATNISLEFGGRIKQIIGDDLAKQGFNAIYTVGKGSSCNSRLIDLRWGKENHPKLTLVGKGVCFDSGGLDLKSPAGMLLMKKDMAGAAHVLALASMIMRSNVPVNLRVLIPAVENMPSGSAYKPGDVIKMYNKTTVEVTNTDAEGRLVLADALSLAMEDEPDLLVDFASLTGAARIALGADIGAFFTDNDNLAKNLLKYSTMSHDPIWRMPIYAGYFSQLHSWVADFTNASLDSSRLGGAIVAALFLQKFVGEKQNWLHFDIMGADSSGHAKMQGVRALFEYIRINHKP
ncbi:MAG: leucyl aminopeptidase family protein [Gammaproteobacteria bacterium]|nr:leucyl aminopeptidase family protein [Gammaproteobacteria bacterium]